MTTHKLLFTPGPLTTGATVKAAMLCDAGSRDAEFIAVVRNIRERLLRIGGAGPGGGYECVPMQGSGTFAFESEISSAIPRDGRLMVLVNGRTDAALSRWRAFTASRYRPWRRRRALRRWDSNRSLRRKTKAKSSRLTAIRRIRNSGLRNFIRV
ncbi:MAG: hypothetical protein ABSG03_03340 [Bryobacteraceae bacterium]